MKKVIALLLGAVFLAFPFAGCKDKAEKEPNIVYSFTEEGDISAKQGDQTLVETKFSYAYHVEMKGRDLWEDSSLKEDLYAELAGKEIALEKTEETALPQGITIKIRLPLLQSFDILVAEDGSVWEAVQTTCTDNYNPTYYASESGAVDYDAIYEIYEALDYEYPYTLKRSADGQVVFGTEEDTIFSFNQEEVGQVIASFGLKDSLNSEIEDDDWVQVFMDVFFRYEITFRECGENSWQDEENLIVSFASVDGVSRLTPLFYFGIGGQIYFREQTTNKVYVSHFNVTYGMGLEKLVDNWRRIQASK